jgi:hypothetical protein
MDVTDIAKQAFVERQMFVVPVVSPFTPVRLFLTLFLFF